MAAGKSNYTTNKRRPPRLVCVAGVASLSLVSCDAKSPPPEATLLHYPDSVNVVTLETSRAFEDSTLSAPVFVELIDELLIVLNSYSEPFVYVLGGDPLEVITAFGRNGEGPGEYQFPSSIVRTSEDDLWLGDPSQGRVTRLSIEALRERGEAYREVRLTGGATLRDLVADGDKGFIGADLTGQATFVRVTPTGEQTTAETTRFGPPPPSVPDVPVTVRAAAYSNAIARNPGTGRLATAGGWTGAVVIYEPDGSVVDSADAPFGFTPVYSINEERDPPSMVPDPTTRKGYLKLKGTRHHILGLFSGRPLSEYRGDIGGQDIHVFDWSGKLLGVFRLPVPVLDFAIDFPGRRLYATRWGLQPSVISARLPGTAMFSFTGGTE